MTGRPAVSHTLDTCPASRPLTGRRVSALTWTRTEHIGVQSQRDSRYRVTPVRHVRNRRRRCTQLWFASAGQADQINTSGQHVQANVLPRARQAPGIVAGFWMTDMAGATLNVMVFESEDAARSALEPVRTAPRPPSMQVESADVYEVLARF
jgi:hypothetical protein